MATVLTHAALPLLAVRGNRRLALAAACCAVAADLDVFTFAWELRPPDLLAHRGLFHSLPMAGLLGLLAALAVFRREWRSAWLPLCAWAAAHPLIDLFTSGEAGVALFAPLTDGRWLSPWRPIPTVPVGADEAFGRFGAAVLLNEVLLLWAPVLLVTRFRSGQPWRVPAGAWALGVVGLKLLAPGAFMPAPSRPLWGFGPPQGDQHPGWIPTDALPDGGLLTRFGELKAAGLFDAELKPEHEPWSSSFFPSWFGGAAGRWRDGRLTLLWRTLSRTAPPATEAEALELGERLAPTEKYDLALGDLTFQSTRAALASTHNAEPRPRFWFGLCNGLAAAALERPEPFRAVTVVSPSGAKVTFAPNDVKALLGSAYYWTQDSTVLGGACATPSFDPTGTCAMNPATFTLAVLNRLGRARRSFLVDAVPSPQSQHYAVARATVALSGAPRAYDGRPVSRGLEGRVSTLVDATLHLTLSATTLPLSSGDEREPGSDSRYRRAGLKPVEVRWPATLALDAQGELIGGAWLDEGPDDVTFTSGGPWVVDGGVLEVNHHLRWDVIDALARASVEENPAPVVALPPP